MDSSERPASERYFRQGKMPVPVLCLTGLPGYVYTDATCLTAMLLLYEQEQQLLEESCKSLFTLLDLFHCDAFKTIIHGRLLHHHHNPTMAKIMVQIGLETIAILPDPAAIFSNLSRPHPSRETSTVDSCLKHFKEWLEIVPLRESCSHLVVLQTGDIANNPMPVANALAQLGLIQTSHSQASLDRLYRRAKCVTLDMMEVCYEAAIKPEPEVENEAAHERRARIQTFIEQHPIASEINELHRAVVSSLRPRQLKPNRRLGCNS
jgi:hypothetical protein